VVVFGGGGGGGGGGHGHGCGCPWRRLWRLSPLAVFVAATAVIAVAVSDRNKVPVHPRPPCILYATGHASIASGREYISLPADKNYLSKIR